MPYTSPPTFVASDPLAADELNILSEDIEYLYGISQGLTFSGCTLRRAASQSIANNTDVDISFDTETYDYGGWYTSGTTVTVPAGAIPAGYTSIAVDIYAAIKYATDGTGKRRVQIEVNGSSVKSWTIGALSSDVTDVQVSGTFVVEAADTITLVGLQTSGGSLNATEGALSVIRRNAVA